MRLQRTATIGIAAFVIVACAVTGSAYALRGDSKTVTHQASTAKVTRGTVTVTASAAGSIASINERALTFGAGGTVAMVKVKAGQSVLEGQVLATLDASDAQDAVDSAQSALDAANTNLALAKQQAAAPTTSMTGCAAQADFVVAKPSPSASPTATPTPTPTPTPSSRSTRPTAPPATKAPTHAPTGRSTSTACSTRGNSGTTNGQQQSSGTDNLLRAEQTVNNDQLALDKAEEALTGVTITAPIAGRVLSVAGAVGDTVSAGGSGFIVLGGASSLAVEASFSEADVAPIKVGQTATVALATHAGVTYKAKVAAIDPAGTTTGTLVKYGVELVFTTVPGDLLIGQSANVAVVTASAPDALYVPAAAISPSATGSPQVTVRTASGDAMQAVTVGLDGDQGTQITSGLSEGQTVVIPAN